MFPDLEQILVFANHQVQISVKKGRIRNQQDRFFASISPVSDNPEKWLRDTFKEIDEITNEFSCGSTATIAYLNGNNITISHLGDSPAILFIQDANTEKITSHHLATPHIPSNPIERKRIEAEGEYIMDIDGVLRVGGFLNISRAFGNKHIKGISKIPDVTTIDINGYKNSALDLAFLCIASDGIFSSDLALGEYSLLLEGVLGQYKTHNIATVITDYALANGSNDNITALFTKITPDTKDGLMAVMDGHGGDEVSEIIRLRLEENHSYQC